MEETRRHLLASMGLVLVAPALAWAQPTKIHRVAFLASVSPLSELTGEQPANRATRAFKDELRVNGFVEGRNLILDARTLEGRLERLDVVIADVVRLKPDAIFLPGQMFAQPAVRHTGQVPIVSLFAGAVVETGLVKSYARPGGTVTGVVVDVDAAVEAKRLELLAQLVPKARRIAFLAIQEGWDSIVGRRVRESAERLGIELYLVRADPASFDSAFATLERERPDAVYVPAGPTNYGRRREIGRFVVAQRLPSSSAHSEFVDEGCLMSYGVDVDALMRRAAQYVAKILNGANPAELPIEQPTKFELIVSRRAARELGITIPQEILLRADRVIE